MEVIIPIRRQFVQRLALTLLIVVLAVAGRAGDGGAKPFVWARSGDALTLDPHAVNEGPTLALGHNIYEPLVVRDRTGKLEPGLAIAWYQMHDPLVWQFTLREGVTFHDGQTLSAQDVVFSFERARAPTSDMRTRLQGVREVRLVGPNLIEITTAVRDPLLPIRLTDILIMSRAWAETHGAMKPQDYPRGEESFAASNANGTGPYRLVKREAGKITKLARFDKYWGWQGVNLATRIDEIDYLPIPDDKARITALLNGSVDFVQDVPPGELEVLRQAPGIATKIGPENRVIFLGLSVRPSHNGQPNPLADARVREALSIAIDRTAIQRTEMLGQSIPTAVLAPPGINGFPFDLDVIPKRDINAARALIEQAGVADQTPLVLDCPSNRYVSDVAICGAIARQLSEIGLKVEVVARDKAAHFEAVRGGKSQFYLLGWGAPTFDSAYIFTNLMHSRGSALGTWNGTGFSDPDVDRKIAGLSRPTENGGRNRAIGQLWQTLQEAMIYLPLHVQTLLYGMRDGFEIEVDGSNAPKLKNATVRPQAVDATGSLSGTTRDEQGGGQGGVQGGEAAPNPALVPQQAPASTPLPEAGSAKTGGG